MIDPSSINKPKGHEQYSDDQIEQCPIMAKQIQKSKDQKQVDILKSSDIEKEPKKVKKPKGGCPFMPSDKKKNPMLGTMEGGFDTAFVSQYEYFFQMCPLLDIALMDKPRAPKERKVFESYPIFLKHSLMIDDDENMKQLREMEISKRFFCYDRFREKGNKEFYKGNYDLCLSFYERAYHTFKWLSYKPPKDEDEEEVEEKKKQQQEETENKSSKNVDNDNEEEEEEKEEEKQIDTSTKANSQDDVSIPGVGGLSEKESGEVDSYMKKVKAQRKEFKEKYKNLMKTYDDDTVVLHDGQDLTDAQDIEMRNSMLHTILMLMSVVYMKLKHFKLAEKCLEESMAIHDKATQVIYRKSQAVALNHWSSLEQLETSKKDIEMAIEMKKFEKIFNSGQLGMLKIMNLHNHEEAYRDQAVYVIQRIHERKEWEADKFEYVLGREKRLQEITAQMIKDGKSPQDRDESVQNELEREKEQSKYDNELEMIVIHEMIKKYYKAIEFYTETKKPEQVSAAKYQLQKLLSTVQEMVFYWEMDFGSWSAKECNKVKGFNFDLSDEKLLKRLDRIKRKKAKEIFDQAQNFNFDIFKWALDDVLKAKKKYDQAKEDEEKQFKSGQKAQAPGMPGWIGQNILQPQFFVTLSIFLILLLLAYQWGQQGHHLPSVSQLTGGAFNFDNIFGIFGSQNKKI